MLHVVRLYAAVLVALLAEGVDRNFTPFLRPTARAWSPSSRRAWIEIPRKGLRPLTRHVALLAEGVDRNTFQRRPAR